MLVVVVWLSCLNYKDLARVLWLPVFFAGGLRSHAGCGCVVVLLKLHRLGACVLWLPVFLQGHRWDPQHLPDKRVRGYAVTTTFAHIMYGLETLHAVRGIQVDPEVTAALKHELKTGLAAVVGPIMLVQRWQLP